MRVLTVLFLLLALPGQALAHQSTTTYARVTVRGDEVHGTLTIATRDLTPALGAAHDDDEKDPTDQEIHAGEGAIFAYVLDRVKIAGCPALPAGLTITTRGDRRAELAFVARCPAEVTRLTLDYDLFFDLDPRATGFLEVTHGSRTIHRELKKGLGHFEWALEASAPTPASLGPLDYLKSGIEHIFTGYDHIAFVVGLLVVAVARRRNGTLEPRGQQGTFAHVVPIVTAFTIAHSITLIGAALDWFALPSRLVESVIALSIVYVAVENVLAPDPRRRWVLAFAFGLVHGLGFAALLRPILPPTGVVVPLLLFNLGVELGQLCIVALLAPVLSAVCARGAAAYRRNVAVPVSVAIGVAGTLWLAERVADVEIFAALGRLVGA